MRLLHLCRCGYHYYPPEQKNFYALGSSGRYYGSRIVGTGRRETERPFRSYQVFVRNLLLTPSNKKSYAKINLTAITDDEGIVLKHFIDCLEIVKYIDEGKKIIDVGTGAGFPGIVIAIFFNGKVEVTLIDALNKRINFLQEVIKELELISGEHIGATLAQMPYTLFLLMYSFTMPFSGKLIKKIDTINNFNLFFINIII